MHDTFRTSVSYVHVLGIARSGTFAILDDCFTEHSKVRAPFTYRFLRLKTIWGDAQCYDASDLWLELCL